MTVHHVNYQKGFIIENNDNQIQRTFRQKGL